MDFAVDNVLGANTKEKLVAKQFLANSAPLLSSSLQQAMGNNSFGVRNEEIFVKKQIAGASNIHQLIDSSTEEKFGVSSFEKGGRMQANKAAAFRKIGFFCDVAGNDGASPGSLAYNGTIPAALLNAELRISQEGVLVFRRTIRSIVSLANEQKAGDRYVELPAFVLLRDDRNVEANLHFAEGQSIAAAGAGSTVFAYLSIDAHVTYKK